MKAKRRYPILTVLFCLTIVSFLAARLRACDGFCCLCGAPSPTCPCAGCAAPPSPTPTPDPSPTGATPEEILSEFQPETVPSDAGLVFLNAFFALGLDPNLEPRLAEGGYVQRGWFGGWTSLPDPVAPEEVADDVDSVVDELMLHPPFAGGAPTTPWEPDQWDREDEQFENEKKLLGEEAAILNREARQLDREEKDLKRKKARLEEDHESLQARRDSLEDKLAKQEDEIRKAKADLQATTQEHEDKIKEKEDEIRTRKVVSETSAKVAEKYKKKYGENWRDKPGLVRRASVEAAKEADRLRSRLRKGLSKAKKEAKDATDKAERRVRGAEGAADPTRRALGQTNEEIEETATRLDDTTLKISENEKAQTTNQKRRDELARQEEARRAREEAKREAERRAELAQLQNAARRAERMLKAMKIFQQMYTWDGGKDGGKRIGRASGYTGSTDFSKQVDDAGKALELSKDVIVKAMGKGLKYGLKHGLAGKASPAGDVAGTVRDSLDAIGETYNLMSQAFTTETAIGAGRYEGAYQNMTDFDKAAEKVGVSFDNSRDRALVSRMVHDMAR